MLVPFAQRSLEKSAPSTIIYPLFVSCANTHVEQQPFGIRDLKGSDEMVFVNVCIFVACHWAFGY